MTSDCGLCGVWTVDSLDSLCNDVECGVWSVDPVGNKSVQLITAVLTDILQSNILLNLEISLL